MAVYPPASFSNKTTPFSLVRLISFSFAVNNDIRYRYADWMENSPSLRCRRHQKTAFQAVGTSNNFLHLVFFNPLLHLRQSIIHFLPQGCDFGLRQAVAAN